MAALEKLRSKAPLLLTIVIGVALLAFIMGDALTSGQTYFGDGNTIANVAGKKIDAIEFQNRYEKASALAQKNNQSTDPAVLQKRIFDEMVTEILLNNEIDALGISVTDQELSEAITGANPRGEVQRFLSQYNLSSASEFYDMAFYPAKYGLSDTEVAPLREQWLELEDQIEIAIKRDKLRTLIVGTIQSNKLDRDAVWEDNAVTSTIAYAKANYTSLKDEDYPVDNKEITAQYNKDKAIYKLDAETRLGYMIAVEIVPSQADHAAAKALVDSAYSILTQTEGIDGVRNNPDLVIGEVRVTESGIRSKDVKEFITSAKVGDVSEPKLSSNVHTIVKLTGKSIEVDSVKIDVIIVRGDQAMQDSVKAMIDGGVAFANITSLDNVQGEEGVWQVLLEAPDSTRTKILNAGKEYFTLNSGPAGAAFCKVVERVAPKPVYEIGNVTYTVYPSSETINKLNDDLQAYILENNTTELFAANAVKAGYTAMPISVSAEDAQINKIEGSRECIKWLFEVKPGSVSPIMKKTDYYVTVALSEIYDDGYTTLDNDQVLVSTTARARNEKKGDALVEKFAGKANDIEGYAALMESKVDTVRVVFGQRNIPKIGSEEPNLAACVATSEVGSIVGPIKGSNAVYVYQLVKNEDTTRQRTEVETDRQFNVARGNNAVLNHSLDILKIALGYENKMMKYF